MTAETTGTTSAALVDTGADGDYSSEEDAEVNSLWIMLELGDAMDGVD